FFAASARASAGALPAPRARTTATGPRAPLLPGLPLLHPPEAAVAVLVVADGGVEGLAAEVGPEGLRDVELGVGDLPEEEVRDAHLAAGADEEVGVGEAGGVEGGGDVGLGDGVGVEAAVAGGGGEDRKSTRLNS